LPETRAGLAPAAPGAALVAALACLPETASPHAFQAGAAGYDAFVEGAASAAAFPPALVALLAAGLMLALWRADGMVAAWPAFLVGQLAGLALAAAVPGGWQALALPLAALLCGLWAALAPGRGGRALWLPAALAGLAAMAGPLEGHPPGTLPPILLAGLAFGGNLVIAASAGLGTLLLQHAPRAPAAIALRIAASWSAAAALMLLAFLVSG